MDGYDFVWICMETICVWICMDFCMEISLFHF